MRKIRLPRDFTLHMLCATREVLLAIRSLIDSSIDHINSIEESIAKKEELKKIEIE